MALETVSSLGGPSILVPAATRQRSLTFGQPIPGAAALALMEAVLAVAVLGGVIILTNVEQIPTGIDSILSMRITVRNVLLLAVLASGWAVIFAGSGLYDAERIRDAVEERRRVCGAVSLGTLLALLLTSLTARGGLRAADLLYFWIAAGMTMLTVRAARRSIARSQSRIRRVLIIGTGLRALRMWQTLSNDDTASHELAGFIDCAGSVPASEDIAHRTIGTLDQLESTLMRHAIDDVCITLPIKSRYPEIQEALLVCERVGVRTKYGADLFETHVAWPRYEGSGSPVVTMHVVPDDYRLTIKRATDIAGALVGLIVLAPLMLATAIAIKATSPGPIFFVQERCGLNRRLFSMFKFRTMVCAAERLQPQLEAVNEAQGPVFKIAADPRITPLGRFLRRTSIDELPQFFNVLRGDMSLVGPRPLPLRDVDRFTRASDLRRFSVRPGLTCLWQISGRSGVAFNDWMRLDLKYIDGWSLALDLVILVRTIPSVLRGTGAQ